MCHCLPYYNHVYRKLTILLSVEKCGVLFLWQEIHVHVSTAPRFAKSFSQLSAIDQQLIVQPTAPCISDYVYSQAWRVLQQILPMNGWPQ